MIKKIHSIHEASGGLITALVVAAICIAVYCYLALAVVHTQIANNKDTIPDKYVVLAKTA